MRISNTSLAKSLIENIHQKDLTTEEKGLEVYNFFKTKGFTLTPKELANALNNIENKIRRKNKFDGNDTSFLEILF